MILIVLVVCIILLAYSLGSGKTCGACRKKIDTNASICPYCRTSQVQART